MKILSIVSLISPYGEYGGPARVAVNHLRALADRGHEVVLAAATRGYDDPPATIDGVPTRLYPARTLVPGTGFAGLGSPGLWRGLRRHVREFDVVHVHAARDLVTLPAARIAQRAGVPTVLQTHGMIDESTNPLAGPLDAALTRPALQAARHVAYLTPRERDSLRAVAGERIALTHVPNGVPEAEHLADPASSTEVLFLARLAPRKRPQIFVEAARALADEFPQATFTLVGPDEGEADAVNRAITASGLGERLKWEGALRPEDTGARLSRAGVYVLPAVDEPYPMAVLEAMSAGLPVVIVDSCGLAPVVAEADAGIVVDDSLESLVAAMRALLADPDAAAERGRRAREHMLRDFTMEAIAERLERLYNSASVA